MRSAPMTAPRYRFRSGDAGVRIPLAVEQVAERGGVPLVDPEERHRARRPARSEEHTSELQSRSDLVCRLLPEKKKQTLLQAQIDRRSPPAAKSSTICST